jgi:HPt (histidine-containing phosphotransfer) domain-containing protein
MSGSGQFNDGNQQIDKQAALAALGGDADLLRELGTMFCEDAPQLLDELQQSVTSGDSEAARRAVHSLKGLSATFYAQPTVELAADLESSVATGELDVLRNGGIDRLRAAIETLASELQNRQLATVS